MMLVPIIALLIGSNLLVTGYVHETQKTIEISQPITQYMIYNSSNIFPNSMSYNNFLQINTSGVKEAIPYLEVNGVAFVGNMNYSVSIIATDIQSFVQTSHPQVSGSLPSKEGQIAIGAILSKLLGLKTENQIKVTIFSQTRDFSITSILNSSSKYDVALLLPLSTIWNEWPVTDQKISYVEIQSSVIPGNIPTSLTIMKEPSLNQVVTSFAAETTNLIQIWVYILLGLSAIVAVAVSYRTISVTKFEYGILRTIGARVSTARILLVFEHLMVSIISIIIGVAAGIVLTQVISTVLNSTFGMTILPAVNLTQIGLLGVSAFALIFLSGLLSIYYLPKLVRSGL